MRVALGLVILFSFVFPHTSLAEERAPGTVAVGSRIFLAPGQPDRQPTGRPPPESAEWTQVAVYLMEMDWFRELRDADPVLGPDQARPAIIRFPESAAEKLSGPRPPQHFGDPALLPKELRIPGFDARPVIEYPGVVEAVSFRPLTAKPTFVATCQLGFIIFLDDEVMGDCVVTVSYPPDPEIVLRAYVLIRRSIPEFVPSIPAIADRLREIARCLDVTEAPPADPEAALAALLAENPTLSGCEERLTS